ncbi:MAG: ComEC family competence protein, partial [Barnesiella sp.]|nr:ComEC family competence protein [Barnesiella sp.]
MNSSSLSAARTPFIRLLVPLLAGILYQEFLCPPIWGNLIPALCGFVLWSSFIKRDSIEEQYHKRSIFGVGLFLIVFSIGAILHGTQNRISQQPSGFYPIAIAHVNDKAIEKKDSYYCPVTITALSDTNGSIVKYKEKIALYFEKGIQARRLEYGDIIGFEFRPKVIPPNTNPYAFDFASFMKHKGISRSQYLTGKQWKYIGEKPKSNLRKATSDLQKHLSDQLQSCNLSKNSTLLLRALLLGERQEFPQDLRSYFSAAGLSHVLAVSGLHMG